MSPEDQREQKIRLLVDLEEANADYRSLREAANYHSDSLANLAEWLKTSPEVKIYSSGRSIHHGFDVIPLPERYAKAMIFTDMLSLGDQIRKAKLRVTDLEARLERL